MTTKREVEYAYRLLLGREPENGQVVERIAQSAPDLAALREQFVKLPEFQLRVATDLHVVPLRVAPDSPPMQVDLDVPPAKLAQMFGRTRAQWHHLGTTEPHWSTLSAGRFRRAAFGDNREQFYATGRNSLVQLLAALQRAGIPLDRGGRLLELGCGVGRVTAHLAGHMRHVVGVDISASHLRLAHQYLAERGIRNVELSQIHAVEELGQLGTFDAFFAVLVLQHNPPPVLHRMLRDMLAALRPGGIGFFQVPTYRVGYRFRADEYLAQRNETEMEMHCLPQPVLFDLLAATDCRLVEMREDDGAGPPQSAISNTLLVQKRGRA